MYIQPLNIFFSASYFFVLRQCSCSCLQRKMFGCGCLMSMYSNVYSVENLLNFAKNFTVQFENVSSEISILAVVRARRHRFPRKSMSRAPADYSETMALFPRFIRDNCRRDNATFTRRRRILSPGLESPRVTGKRKRLQRYARSKHRRRHSETRSL